MVTCEEHALVVYTVYIYHTYHVLGSSTSTYAWSPVKSTPSSPPQAAASASTQMEPLVCPGVWMAVRPGATSHGPPPLSWVSTERMSMCLCRTRCMDSAPHREGRSRCGGAPCVVLRGTARYRGRARRWRASLARAAGTWERGREGGLHASRRRWVACISTILYIVLVCVPHLSFHRPWVACI